MRLLTEIEVLSPRSSGILNYIVRQYIEQAAPVPSQDIADKAELGVSPATIRNEMAYLEKEGYLIRPHTSAGCIPSDKGYRHYVESIEPVRLPLEEQHLISHTFHQAEKEVEAWVSLTATLLARLVQNVAVVSLPKSTDCKLKHVEFIAVHDTQALAVVVLDGAKVKQKLINFSQPVSQPSLTVASNKMNLNYNGLTAAQIIDRKIEQQSPLEKQATDFLVEMMQAEDRQEYQEPYLEGWHFILNQPEFAQADKMRSLMELVEQRGLLRVIVPETLQQGVKVIIGRENQSEAIQNCSVVISRYGLPEEATGTIAVVGPTRMPYTRTIPTVYYLSSVLTQLLAGLYGREIRGEQEKH